MSNKKVKESYIDSKNTNFRLNKKANQTKIRNAKKNKEYLQESDNLVGELPSGAFDLNNNSEKKIEEVKEYKESFSDVLERNDYQQEEEDDDYESFDDSYFEPVVYKG
jgi:hypothetical protein